MQFKALGVKRANNSFVDDKHTIQDKGLISGERIVLQPLSKCAIILEVIQGTYQKLIPPITNFVI